MYRLLIRPVLFLFPPETAHKLTFALMGLVQDLGLSSFLSAFWPSKARPYHEVNVFGLRFRNPVGLAAGFDKDARLLRVWDKLGFGYIEVGTVTPKPQPGNEKPRLFRLVQDQGLINRMGFNNAGVLEMAARLEKFRRKHPNSRMIIGGNIGKNKVTPNELAARDYLVCMDELYPYVDFFAVNVSSPNTPGLRDLQDKEPLTALLGHLKAKGREYAEKHGVSERPILLKIAPDLGEEGLRDALGAVRETSTDGIIATNTTISRDALPKDPGEPGGLSGLPLRRRSTEVIRFLREEAGEGLPIIGVGGVITSADALEKLKAGSILIQLYTGFIYTGPSLLGSILSRLPLEGSAEA